MPNHFFAATLLQSVQEKPTNEETKEYQKRTSSSILITSHNLNEVQAMCSNIILLKSGEIVSQGNIKQVLKKFNYKTLIELFLNEG